MLGCNFPITDNGGQRILTWRPWLPVQIRALSANHSQCELAAESPYQPTSTHTLLSKSWAPGTTWGRDGKGPPDLGRQWVSVGVMTGVGGGAGGESEGETDVVGGDSLLSPWVDWIIIFFFPFSQHIHTAVSSKYRDKHFKN